MVADISKMTLDDLNKIASSLESDFDDFWNENILRNELSNQDSYYIVAKINNSILGFAGIWKALDEVHITNIVVKKDHRNLKIGSLLLENLINIAKSLKNVNSITLEVNEKNISAIKLYEKFNFQKLGIRKKYYNNCDNAIIMTLFFDN